MSNLRDYLREQDEITAACEARPHDAREFTFSVKVFAAIRVKAKNVGAARRLLIAHIDCADANFGAWPNGDPIIAETTMDDAAPCLIEIEGEAV